MPEQERWYTLTTDLRGVSPGDVLSMDRITVIPCDELPCDHVMVMTTKQWVSLAYTMDRHCVRCKKLEAAIINA